ncbi:MAG: Sjogren's syndrome/scleroderma autoantigen 1 family protein [Methanotrichaceae archaeon]
MDEEEMLKRITGLLEQGCTMLATHHSCGAPLFRRKGQVVCPVCSFGEEGATEDRSSEMKKESSGFDQDRAAQEERLPSEQAFIDRAGIEKAGADKAGIEKAEPGLDTSSQERLSAEEADLRKAILRKLKELANGIEKEHDLDKLRKQFNCIEAALRALRSMER